jgi:RNA dependent RNA polymerase
LESPISAKRKRIGYNTEDLTRTFLDKLKEIPIPRGPTKSRQSYVFGRLPFAIDWEVSRVDHHFPLNLDNCGDWLQSLEANIDDPKRFWNCLRSRAAFIQGITPAEVRMPEASSNKAWELVQSNGWENGEVHLKLALEYVGRNWKYTPRPMEIKASRRAYRRFGADRFIQLSVSRTTVYSHQRQICKFFQEPLSICGRQYRVFFVKEGPNETFAGQYFATDGAGLMGKEYPIDLLFEWLLSLNNNCMSAASKLWSRISLALSSTKPSVVFTRDQIRLIEDIKSLALEDMTDGCAKASPAVFREIWRSGVLATKETPTAVQGRIGAAKGVWYVDPLADHLSDDKWIEIRPSQLKFKYDPITFQDDHLRTLV